MAEAKTYETWAFLRNDGTFTCHPSGAVQTWGKVNWGTSTPTGRYVRVRVTVEVIGDRPCVSE